MESGVTEEKRSTTWYLWKCPKKGCRHKVESTVKGFTLTNAEKHLGKHENMERKATRLKTREAILAGAIQAQS